MPSKVIMIIHIVLNVPQKSLLKSSHPKRYLPNFPTRKNPLIIPVTWNLEYPPFLLGKKCTIIWSQELSALADNTLLDLHISSGHSQPYPIIANFWPSLRLTRLIIGPVLFFRSSNVEVNINTKKEQDKCPTILVNKELILPKFSIIKPKDSLQKHPFLLHSSPPSGEERRRNGCFCRLAKRKFFSCGNKAGNFKWARQAHLVLLDRQTEHKSI